MTQATDILSALADAHRALQSQPALEAEIANLKQQLAAEQAAFNQISGELAAAKQANDDLSAKVARLEVERDEAGFRELEALDRLDKVRQSLSGILGTGQNLMELVSPKPVVEVAVEPAAELKEDTAEPMFAPENITSISGLEPSVIGLNEDTWPEGYNPLTSEASQDGNATMEIPRQTYFDRDIDESSILKSATMYHVA